MKQVNKHYCKRVVGKDRNGRITSIIKCNSIIVDDFSDTRQEYTIYMYDENDLFIGNLFCYSYEVN